jgi:hypothetical protein
MLWIDTYQIIQAKILEHLHLCSVGMWPSKMKLDEEKSKYGGWLSKLVLALHFSTGCWGWKKAQHSLTPAVNWLDSLIDPGGLLLVIFNLFAVPVLVLWVC